ncbi:synaptotagmin-like protein 2 isoform X2 [Acipenser ruthenus]|uniref:synaptotagmin-like protein 2 isoform X2 n=1 Tax=Acipenser ruthenus TaxID=7906 RepID=UPI00145B3547|nr:synaptotagmin-like protein 2 isoform X2 [Acipenser ruthenus]
MKSEADKTTTLDLSFLSVEEENAVLQVLNRDAQLRNLENGRVRQLKLSKFDPGKLKIMTGEWFDEMKCRRYGENYSVIDVVRSSFRRKTNPATQGNFVTNLEGRRRVQIIGEPARTPLLQTTNPLPESYSSVAQRHSSPLLTQTKNENMFELPMDLANAESAQKSITGGSQQSHTEELPADTMTLSPDAAVPLKLTPDDVPEKGNAASVYYHLLYTSDGDWMTSESSDQLPLVSPRKQAAVYRFSPVDPSIQSLGPSAVLDEVDSPLVTKMGPNKILGASDETEALEISHDSDSTLEPPTMLFLSPILQEQILASRPMSSSSSRDIDMLSPSMAMTMDLETQTPLDRAEALEILQDYDSTQKTPDASFPEQETLARSPSSRSSNEAQTLSPQSPSLPATSDLESLIRIDMAKHGVFPSRGTDDQAEARVLLQDSDSTQTFLGPRFQKQDMQAKTPSSRSPRGPFLEMVEDSETLNRREHGLGDALSTEYFGISTEDPYNIHGHNRLEKEEQELLLRKENLFGYNPNSGLLNCLNEGSQRKAAQSLVLTFDTTTPASLEKSMEQDGIETNQRPRQAHGLRDALATESLGFSTEEPCYADADYRLEEEEENLLPRKEHVSNYTPSSRGEDNLNSLTAWSPRKGETTLEDDDFEKNQSQKHSSNLEDAKYMKVVEHSFEPSTFASPSVCNSLEDLQPRSRGMFKCNPSTSSNESDTQQILHLLEKERNVKRVQLSPKLDPCVFHSSLPSELPDVDAEADAFSLLTPDLQCRTLKHHIPSNSSLSDDKSIEGSTHILLEDMKNGSFYPNSDIQVEARTLSEQPSEVQGSQSQPAVIDVSPEGCAPLQIPCSASIPAILEDNYLECDDDLSSVSSFGSDISAQKRSRSLNLLSASGLSGSWMSLYSDAGDFGNVCVQGAVEFALLYSDVNRELVILVEQCQDLAIANVKKQRTDPYVKTYLYPEKSRLSKRKTSVKKNTVNPVYKEPLTYKMTKVELQTRTLHLSVWHNDSLGRNAFLGEVQIDLRTWDWRFNDLNWYNLQPKNPDAPETSSNKGQLTVALKYVPTGSIDGAKPATGELHIWLKEARNLKAVRPSGVDSFVKCYILPDTSKKGRQKTRVVKKSLNPIYNHTMVYDGFRHEEIKEACCELTIWDHDTFSNQYLGGVRLSLGTGKSYGRNMDWMDSVDEEIEVWRSMISKPNGWVEAVLPLRPSMAKKK